MKKQMNKLFLLCLSLVMILTIFTDFEAKAEENKYNIENIKNYDLESFETNQKIEEIKIKEMKTKNNLKVQGESENENFRL
ncbi:TPA: hypothetical protein PBS81_002661, partial [Staphylococcus aureus]|nr:hypothetical protein [Staphylococcus aureus]